MSKEVYFVWIVEGREKQDAEWYLYEVFRTREQARHWLNYLAPGNTRFRIRQSEVE